MSDREKLEAEAREAFFAVVATGKVTPLADWAERLVGEAVAEERKALREIVRKHGCTDHRHNILAALDAREKAE